MQFETWLKSDLKKPLSVIDLKGNFFTEDSGANLVGVELYDNGQPVTISGTITGYVIRQDGAMVPPITGTACACATCTPTCFGSCNPRTASKRSPDGSISGTPPTRSSPRGIPGPGSPIPYRD